MNKSNAIFRISLMNGLITGIIFCLITALIYLLDINMFSSLLNIAGIWILNLCVVIIAMVISIKKVRETVIDQTLNYGGRFFTGLIIGVIAAWVSGVFSYLLFQVIDPEWMVQQIEGMADMLMNMGVPEDDAYQQVDDAKENLKPAKQFLSAFVYAPIFYIVVSLIVSAFVKEKKAGEIETN